MENEKETPNSVDTNPSTSTSVESPSSEPEVAPPTTEVASPTPDDNAPSTATSPEPTPVKTTNKKHTAPVLITVFCILALGALGLGGFFLLKNGDTETPSEANEVTNKPLSRYYLESNSLADFDLAFLQLENEPTNKLYSPLSIKYALGMLEEGTAGTSREQISNIIGSYTPRKYPNSKNMSFANVIFIKDKIQDDIKESYTDTLRNKFNADVLFDPFTTPDTLNDWVNNKTLGLIPSLFNDVKENTFVLANALAIDMEWKNRIQPKYGDKLQGATSKYYYNISWPKIKYSKNVENIDNAGYHKLTFNDDFEASSVELAAVANKYNILKDLGEEKIRSTVTEEYEKWLAETEGVCSEGETEDVVNRYMQDLGNGGYGDVTSSTDFYFYNNDGVKLFAKDLKEYDGISLQYVGIMPTSMSLVDFINQAQAANIDDLLKSLKPIELNSFKDGVLTEISAYIPLFNFDYELDLKEELKKLGVLDIFDDTKADLSGLSNEKYGLQYIQEAKHKANIDFSNEGIKAAAVTAMAGGLGGAGCRFVYDFEIPVEKIDLTFDKPYLFLIRDKDSGEIWFAGTVYEPAAYVNIYSQK